jgi:SAM-dependent methyltransferase
VRTYPDAFYQRRQQGADRSARAVLPPVLEAVRPRRVIDVGCGTGDWLAVCRELGVAEVCGLDGPWVDRGRLRIPPECFHAADLSQPLPPRGPFDLVLSLEVAEHLAEACAAAFIASLTGLGPVVLFSAAVPFQGGVGHVNEQWPAYWAAHFARHNYVAVDCVRRRVWDNPDVCWWYAQNTLLWVREDRLDNYPALRQQYDPSGPPLALVHPRKFLEVADPANLSLRRLCGLVRSKLRAALARRLGRRARPS